MLTPESILANLGTSIIPREVRCFQEVGSTMDEARAALLSGSAQFPLLLLADLQTAGRGRRGRTWVTPPGSALLFSLALRPTWLAPSAAPALIWLAAVSLCEGIRDATGLQPRLKWPNDLLLPLPAASLVQPLHTPQSEEPTGWHKISGILLEASSEGENLAWAIIGCGLNVNAGPPPDVNARYPASHLSAALGQQVDRLPLMQAILRRFDYWYGKLQSGARDSLFTAWSALLVTVGQQVEVQTAEGTLYGMAESVDATGALHVRDEQGQLHVLTNGDVS
jgi:BirA family biotin operon repressor/biotin-[acetyl-CoA-carboxylase] ligase